ncbi:MAG: agmatinase [Methanomassiliicoccales archaeon]|nr:agmatinase [Methanomassiliicoccales archaeon]
MARSDLFAMANSTFDEAEFVIMGVPYDGTTRLRSGTRKAPAAIRKASNIFDPYLFEHKLDLSKVKVHDAGDVDCGSSCDDMFKAVEEKARRIINTGKFPILIGGERSITYPLVKAYDEVGVISIDAHLDFRSECNMKFNHACTMKRVAEVVGIENIVPFGVRSISKEELFGELPNYVDAYQIREGGLDNSWKKALNMMRRENVLLSLDMDGIDPGFAPGTSRPEPFGLTGYEVKRCIDMVGDRLVGFDISEVLPSHDPGATAALAARFIMEVIAIVHTRRGEK